LGAPAGRRARPALDRRHRGRPGDGAAALCGPRPGGAAGRAGRAAGVRARAPGHRRAQRAHRAEGPDGVILVRTDASAGIGLGHAMRCLALVQVAGQGRFLMADPPPAFAARAGDVARLAAAPGGAADAEETARAAAGAGADWVVVDGYHFDGGYQQALVDA